MKTDAGFGHGYSPYRGVAICLLFYIPTFQGWLKEILNEIENL